MQHQSDDDEDDVNAGESEYEGDEVMVRVGATDSVPLSEVTDAMVARMTTTQKNDYIRLAQQLYDQFNH